MPVRGLGWSPDIDDVRDVDYQVLLKTTELPDEVSLEVGPVLDQGVLGSCVAQAVATLIYQAHLKQQVDNPELLSRLALYYFARAVNHMEKWDSGTYIRTAMKVINKLGFCPETAWPYDDFRGPGARFRKQPPTRVFRFSFDQTFAAGRPVIYRKILSGGDERLQAIKECLAGGSAVAFGTNVTHDFVNGDIEGVVDKPTASDTIAGGHAMVIYGYDQSGFHIRNSWGTDFGHFGNFVMSEDYIAWGGSRDFTVIEVAPNFGL